MPEGYQVLTGRMQDGSGEAVRGTLSLMSMATSKMARLRTKVAIFHVCTLGCRKKCETACPVKTQSHNWKSIIMDGVENELESMEEAMFLFIQFIEESHPNDAHRRADEYTGMLLRISSGAWAFPTEFCEWRTQRAPTRIAPTKN
jgi:hypothetical protein